MFSSTRNEPSLRCYLLTLGLCALSALVGCNRPPSVSESGLAKQQKADTTQILLSDVAEAAGVQFTYQNGHEADVLSIVESLGGGVGIADFDVDGQMDIFFPGGGRFEVPDRLVGRPNCLYRQITKFRFADVSTYAQIHDSVTYSHGCTIGDFDSDGFPDYLVTGYGGLQFYSNQGDGTFREIHAEAGLNDNRWTSSAACGDFNSDGYLDIYVAHYVNWSWDFNPECFARPEQRDICPPRDFQGVDDTLYLSTGHGTFDDATQRSRLVNEGKGLGVLVADIDGDGDVDVYVANDTVDNYCYLNDGNGLFQEYGTVSGLAADDRGAPNGSMGIALLDYDNNLRPDIWVTNYENESFALYRNEGAASFTHVSQVAGIYALGSSYVGFGTAACDLDRDGDEDLVVSNGHVVNHPQSGSVRQKPLLLLNEGGRFKPEVFSADTYFGQSHVGRGLAVADLDNDGDTDIVVSHCNAPSAILKNETVTQSNWLGVKLVGIISNRDAIGARVKLVGTDRTQLRSVIGGGSYLSQSEYRLLWGTQAGDLARRLEITWPSGIKQELPIVGTNRHITVVEPQR